MPTPKPDALALRPEAPAPAALAADRAAKVAREAYDAKSGTWLPVTAAMRERESRLREAWSVTKQAQAVLVHTVFAEKLYLAAGYETREQYVEEALGISRRAAYNLAAVGRRLGPYLPSSDSVLHLGAGTSRLVLDEVEDGSANIALSGSVDVDPQASAIVQTTRVSTLYQLASLDDETMDELLRGDTLTLDSGRTVTLSDLRSATAREAQALVKALKKEYRDRLSRDQERAIAAEQERDVYAERLDDAQKQADVGYALELKYGPIQARAEAQMKLISDAREQITRLAVTLGRIGPDESEEPIPLPDAVESDIVALIGRLHEVVTGFENRQHESLYRA